MVPVTEKIDQSKKNVLVLVAIIDAICFVQKRAGTEVHTLDMTII